MPVPKYDDFYNVVLKFLADGEFHAVDACKNFVRAEMKLTDADIAELKSDGQPKWLARVDWCLITLEKSGMIRFQDAQIQITDDGQKFSGEKVTMKLLMERGSPELVEYVKNRRAAQKISAAPSAEKNADETPEEILERVHCEINDELSDELLSLLLEKSPQFFEQFILKLIERMGYGIGKGTQYSGDGGIDGIVYGDKLGFDRIGIQAKLWSTDKTVGRPEIQKFYGALASSEFGKIDRGLFVTTAKFSVAAKEYADKQHIILIDGKRLAELMIEFDVGVFTQKVYKIKRVDKDFFNEN